MGKQKVNDVIAVASLVFFIIVMFVGLYSLEHMHSSNIALDASVIGIVGVIVSLFVAVPLILSEGKAYGE
jgi:amino acid transporter